MIFFCFVFYLLSLHPFIIFHYWMLIFCAKKGLKHSARFSVTFMSFDLGLMALSFHTAFIKYSEI